MKKTFKAGMQLGREQLAYVAAQGKRWKSRNIPHTIRHHLMPYYITELEGCLVIFVLHVPLGGGKVGYREYAREERACLPEGYFRTGGFG